MSVKMKTTDFATVQAELLQVFKRLFGGAVTVLVLTACAGIGQSNIEPLNQPAAFTEVKTPAAQPEIVVSKPPESKRDPIVVIAETDLNAQPLYPEPEQNLWERIRKGFTIPDLKTKAANQRTQWYARQPKYMRRMADRSSKYLYHIVTELEKRNMPMELALLPFVESAFNPEALSSAKAAGMWQFMPKTGHDFDLKQTLFRDDRRNIQASTDAALNYLQQLYDTFGDWHLALASYNWGPGNVQKAIRKNKKRGLSTRYASLRMPAETRNYVPKLQAIENIVMNPGLFGIKLPEIPNHPYFQVIAIDKDMDVALAASLAEIPEDDFRSLNPSFNRPLVLAETVPEILLPWDQAEVFLNNLQEYKGPLSSWTTWRVPKTMRQKDAARKVGVSAAELRKVNGIKSSKLLIRKGSTLLVPSTNPDQKNIEAHVAESARLRLQPEYVRKTVVVRKGDTLSGIAARYGVSMQSIARLNRLSNKSLIRIGQRLQVVIPRYR